MRNPPPIKDSGAFTALEIAQANSRHDRDYGWAPQWPQLYSNPFRLPESVVGPPFQLDQIKSPNDS